MWRFDRALLPVGGVFVVDIAFAKSPRASVTAIKGYHSLHHRPEASPTTRHVVRLAYLGCVAFATPRIKNYVGHLSITFCVDRQQALRRTPDRRPSPD